MLQLILSPTHGWEDISYDSAEPRKLMMQGFIPWLLIAAASSAIQLIYGNGAEVLSVILEATVTFLKYFVTYYIAGFAFAIFMPRFSAGSKSAEKHNHTFIIYSLGLMVLWSTVKHCLPIDMAILNFFPLYVILIMWRGVRYMRVASMAVIPFVGLTIFTIIIPPILIQLLFNLISPI
ncbi:MAG: hypothetical protein NC043_02125 [Muribaculaceae bacterium]|nr:hypothetical protein [Muribaculaceae bacterium]